MGDFSSLVLIWPGAEIGSGPLMLARFSRDEPEQRSIVAFRAGRRISRIRPELNQTWPGVGRTRGVFDRHRPKLALSLPS